MSIDYIIAGFAKCGTSGLAQTLWQHPQVAIPKKPLNPTASLKELHLFSHKWDQFEYMCKTIFSDSSEIQLRGDATPHYVQDARIAERIMGTNANCRIIIMMRDPREAVISYFTMRLKKDQTKGISDFNEFTHRYMSHGGIYGALRYADKIKPWLNTVPSSSLMLIRSEDYFADSLSIMLETQAFIGLPPIVLSVLNPNAQKHVDCSQSTWDRLTDYYRPQVRELERLTGHKWWEGF